MGPSAERVMADRPKAQPVDRSTKLTRAISDITGWLGSFPAILLSAAVVAIWFIGGIFIGLGNNTYQLVINTTTTIVTFLMVFIIQNTQNRDGSAVQAKLDAQSEVLRTLAEKMGIDDDEHLLTKLVGVEDAPADEIKNDQDLVREKAAHTRRQDSSLPVDRQRSSSSSR